MACRTSAGSEKKNAELLLRGAESYKCQLGDFPNPDEASNAARDFKGSSNEECVVRSELYLAGFLAAATLN